MPTFCRRGTTSFLFRFGNSWSLFRQQWQETPLPGLSPLPSLSQFPPSFYRPWSRSCVPPGRGNRLADVSLPSEKSEIACSFSLPFSGPPSTALRFLLMDPSCFSGRGQKPFLYLLLSPRMEKASPLTFLPPPLSVLDPSLFAHFPGVT